MTTRTCLLIAFSLCTFNRGATAHAQQEPNTFRLHDITHAAEQRWEKLRSGRIEWTETKWMEKAALLPPGWDGKVGSPSLPPENVTHTYRNLLEFDGDNYRFERQGPTWNARERKYFDTAHIGVWDGHKGSVLRHDLGFPHGEIYPHGWDRTQPPVRPLVFGLRPLHPRWFEIDLSELVIADRTELIGGFQCIAVETSPEKLRAMQAAGRRPWKRTYWISPQQQFAIVRSTLSLTTLPAPSEDISIVYAHDAEAGWYPSKWKFVEGGGSGGPPTTIIEGTVTKCALNVPPAPERFDFSFPEGTWVRDTRAKEDGSYIVRRDGAKRPVTQEELLRGSTYDDLLKTDSGQARLQPAVPR